jgi:hypothetical protein
MVKHLLLGVRTIPDTYRHSVDREYRIYNVKLGEYCAETWTLQKVNQKCLERFEM